MKSLRVLLPVLTLLLAALAPSALAETAMYAPLPPSKDLYSFADLYRLTTGAVELPLRPGATPVAQPTAAQQFQIRTVAGEAPAAAQPSPYVFSIDRAAKPQGGPLLLAGLAAALWVARRRLGYAIRG
jgi:hypothetical protein